jgi:hypothetical protein
MFQKVFKTKYSKALFTTSLTLCLIHLPCPIALAQDPVINSEEVPRQILKSGVNLNTTALSVNTEQLAQDLKILDNLKRICQLRNQLANIQSGSSQFLAERIELLELVQKTQNKLMRAAAEIDFVTAEIDAEQNIYSEVLSTYQSDRDRTVARTNAISFITNGALWALSCALNIPSYKYAGYSVQTGITGIVAGLVPSVASMWALKQYSGHKRTSETEPNMLAKIFGYQINPEIDYPASVWSFLNTIPANGDSKKTRKEQLIDRWITDKNLPTFTDKKNQRQLDCLTACCSHKKGLTIDNLNTRMVMLEQLQGEVMKMNRLLLEMAMVLTEDKQVEN